MNDALIPTEKTWISLILVSEKGLLCSSGCGAINIIAFLWGCIVHPPVGLHGKALIFPFSGLGCFLLVFGEPWTQVETFSNTVEEDEFVF